MSNKSRRETLLQARKNEKQIEFELKVKMIEMVKSREALWNINIQDYRDREVVDAHWNEISATLQIEKEYCKKLWKNMKDHFRNTFYEMTYRNNSEPFEKAVASVRWKFFPHLLFLKDAVRKRSIMGKALNREESVHTSPILTTPSPTLAFPSVPEGDIKEEIVTEPMCAISSSNTSEAEIDRSSSSATEEEIENHSRKRKRSEVEANIVTDLQSIIGTIKTRDRVSKFGAYLVDILKDIPPSRRMKCELLIIQVAHAFAEGRKVEVTISENTDGPTCNRV